MSFMIRMAWRDFRAKPSRFLLYAVAIALGSGSLAAIDSFRAEIAASIEAQGRNLLGADLLVRSRRPFTPDQRLLIDRWTGRVAMSVSYRTMILDPASGQSRLVEVNAADPAFPFYGSYDTEPPEAAGQSALNGQLLADYNLMLQLGWTNGVSVRLGGRDIRIAGAMRQTPGEVPARSLMAPRVFLPLFAVDRARIEQPGTMARFEAYLAVDQDTAEPEAWVGPFAEAARRLGLDVETVASRREQLMGGTDRIGRYLGLMGFSALVIACLGVAGAVHSFVMSKRRMVAQLRCIGARLHEAAGIFMIQLIGLAAVGVSLGVMVGAGLVRVLPELLSGFLPLPVEGRIRLDSIAAAWSMGFGFTLLSGCLPICRLRHVRALASLRMEERTGIRLDAMQVAIALIILAGLFWFAARQLGSPAWAGAYLGGLLTVLLMLFITGWAVRAACRKVFRAGWPFAVRLAVSGLYRPHNQTCLLVVALGMGVFLVRTIDDLERHVLMDLGPERRDRPNLALIDIQPDQIEPLQATLDAFPHEQRYIEPMITMRLAAINGVAIEQLEDQAVPVRQNWALKREYRTTYRGHQKPEIETVIAGAWVDRHVPGELVVPVSLEQGIAEALAVGVDDRLTFDVHGITFETRVANLREVDWKSMQPNFFVIFPPGVLEEAPQSSLLFCRIADPAPRAGFQSAVARAFPNITTIDISLILDSVTAMLQRLGVAVRAIALITLAAGFLVLLAVIRAGQEQRIQEAVLLRIIGSSRRVILVSQMLEFFVLAAAAVLTGVVLSTSAGYFVVTLGMELDYQPQWGATWLLLGVMLGAVATLGVVSLSRINRIRPAEAWRRLSLSAS